MSVEKERKIVDCVIKQLHEYILTPADYHHVLTHANASANKQSNLQKKRETEMLALRVLIQTSRAYLKKDINCRKNTIEPCILCFKPVMAIIGNRECFSVREGCFKACM